MVKVVILSFLPGNLPSSAEVFADLQAQASGSAPRFPAHELSSRVFTAWYRALAWYGTSGVGAELAVDSGLKDALLGVFAELLVTESRVGQDRA